MGQDSQIEPQAATFTDRLTLAAGDVSDEVTLGHVTTLTEVKSCMSLMQYRADCFQPSRVQDSRVVRETPSCSSVFEYALWVRG